MSSVWIEGPTVNAVPYRVFVTRGKPKVVAAIVFADDRQFYLAYTRDVKNVVNDIILASPFIDRNRKKYLVFKYNNRRIKATGYLVKAASKYEFDIFTEEVRYVTAAALGKPIKVRKLKSEEELPEVSKKLSEEEKKIFELAPIDVPTEIEEKVEQVAVEAAEADEENEGGGKEAS